MAYIDESNTFFNYFGYASNMNSTRIHLDNKSAVKVGIGKLLGYSLSFGYSSAFECTSWAGGCANITESTPEDAVYGVVWKMDLAELPILDRQECTYAGLEVTVHLEDGRSVTCRCYHIPKGNMLQKDPTPAYKNVCLEGAIENHLPQTYITKLMAIKDNGDPAIPPIVLRMEEAKKELQRKT